MSDFQRFHGFSSMTVGEGTFRVSWDPIHEQMKIEYIKHGIYVAISLDGNQGEAAGHELVRLAQDAKAKGQIPAGPAGPAVPAGNAQILET
jgi:hypothetical protein